MALLVAGCASDPEDHVPAAQQSNRPDLAHIHGLGINPADGRLYVASHHGVFLVTGEGEPRQIAGRSQDFMGFTVVGPNHFLGSGHPGPGDITQPSHVGLIESTDGAQTWATLSLSGEVDFHALEAAHGNVYGYDSQSGQIMVSTDKQTWDRRATVTLADIAVSPDDAEVILGTTEQGPIRSTDGGRRFVPIDNAPTLVFVDWLAPGRLVGVTPDGTVHTSPDGGNSWDERGRVSGSPQAILLHGDSELYVATSEAIYRSRDGGTTFGAFQSLA